MLSGQVMAVRGSGLAFWGLALKQEIGGRGREKERERGWEGKGEKFKQRQEKK